MSSTSTSLLERASAYRPGGQARRRLAHEADASNARQTGHRPRRGGREIDAILKGLVAETAPELSAVIGVGTDVASALLVAAGDNPERLKSEATFAHLCGASRSTRAAARTSAIGSTVVVTARRTQRCGTSCSRAWSATLGRRTTSSAG